MSSLEIIKGNPASPVPVIDINEARAKKEWDNIRTDHENFGPQLRALEQAFTRIVYQNPNLRFVKDNDTLTVLFFIDHLANRTRLNTIKINPDNSLKVASEDITDELRLVGNDKRKIASVRPVEEFDQTAVADHEFVGDGIAHLQNKLIATDQQRTRRGRETVSLLTKGKSEDTIAALTRAYQKYPQAVAGAKITIAKGEQPRTIITMLISGKLLDDGNRDTLLFGPPMQLTLNNGYQLIYRQEKPGGKQTYFDLKAPTAPLQ